uniref:Uncharacterized protein n=1 Tax=Neobodo designis TaxID=312471 RepID=A0A7S1L4M5_NEODS
MPNPFEDALRDHSYYYAICGLTVASAAIVLTLEAIDDVEKWLVVLSIILSLSVLVGLMIAGIVNFVSNFNGGRVTQGFHVLAHGVLIIAFVLFGFALLRWARPWPWQTW